MNAQDLIEIYLQQYPEITTSRINTLTSKKGYTQASIIINNDIQLVIGIHYIDTIVYLPEVMHIACKINDISNISIDLNDPDSLMLLDKIFATFLDHLKTGIKAETELTIL